MDGGESLLELPDRTSGPPQFPNALVVARLKRGQPCTGMGGLLRAGAVALEQLPGQALDQRRVSVPGGPGSPSWDRGAFHDLRSSGTELAAAGARGRIVGHAGVPTCLARAGHAAPARGSRSA